VVVRAIVQAGSPDGDQGKAFMVEVIRMGRHLEVIHHILPVGLDVLGEVRPGCTMR
jgi:hypothetical protein